MDIKDSNFDQEIVNLFTEISPSEEELPMINPWSMPIGFITWGLILTTVKLEFFKLQYILPTVGVLLVFLGFRSLRNENKFFKLAWLLSILKLLVQLVDLILLSTPLNYILNQEASFELVIVMLIMQITMFLLFHKGLMMVYKKANKTMEDNPLIWISVWTIIAAILAYTSWNGSFIVWITMMIAYYYIARTLYHIGDHLEDARYFMTIASVKISNRVFGWSFIGISLIIVIGSGIIFSHLKLDPKEYVAPMLSEERRSLVELGFPEDLLSLLSDEDTELLSGAINIEAYSEVLMLDPKDVEIEDRSEGYVQITHTYEPGRTNLEATTVYIETPNNQIYVMQYFSWISGSPVWQDGITIPIAYDANKAKLVSSGLFYEKKDVEYAMPFPRLTLDEFESTYMFETSQNKIIVGALSFPFISKNERGYVLYRYTINGDSNLYLTFSTLNYAHNENPTFIPYEKTENQMLNGAYFFDDNQVQLYTTYVSVAQKQIEEDNE
ncbi:MAG: hypothetical protein GX829_10005 [Clostridium sp.]|nr:hypothetical protein [Clostridium sp.]